MRRCHAALRRVPSRHPVLIRPLHGLIGLLLPLPAYTPVWAGEPQAPAPASSAGSALDAPPETQAPETPKADPPPPAPPADPVLRPSRPPPLHIEYIQYGVAIAAEVNLSAGGTCAEQNSSSVPCILGSGGGPVIRLGYRTPGPWYVGGAYEFIKMDSGNLYRLGIFQQLRAELRYLPDLGSRVAPFFTVGLGGVAYGNEWGAETGGGVAFLGAGIEIEVTRHAIVGAGISYRTVLLAPWTDTAGHDRMFGVSQFLGLEVLLELRSESGRR